jgi:Helix-turn-helix domain
MSAGEVIPLWTDGDHRPTGGDGRANASNAGAAVIPLDARAAGPVRSESINLSEVTPVDKLRFLTRLAADKRLNATDLRCAIVIADYFNRDKKRAWPSYARLVRDTGASRASVARSVRKLDELGLIHRVGGHQGRSNSYVPDFTAPKPNPEKQAAHFRDGGTTTEVLSLLQSQPRDGHSLSGETTSISPVRHYPTSSSIPWN